MAIVYAAKIIIRKDKKKDLRPKSEDGRQKKVNVRF